MAARPLLRRALSALCAAGVWFVPPVMAMAAALLVWAETAGGRLAALTFLLGPPGLLILGMGPLLPSLQTPRARRLGWTLSALGLIAWLAALSLAPKGETPADASLRSVWLDGASFRRSALANVVPEIDQFTLGSHLVGYVDPYIDGPQATRLRESFQAVYRELREDPEFLAVGSVMSRAYLNQEGGHLYVYDPSAGEPEAKPRPVILFLHGSAGAFKGYQWVWRELAEREGWAVVSPSFGFGHWANEGGVPLVAQTLSWIAAQPELDASRVVLAGLSNGGLGVSRAATALPEAFDAVLYISPVIEPQRMPELAACYDGPITVLTGDADRRIPLSYVQQAVGALERGGAEVSFDVAPGADHFLFFADRAWVLERAAGALPEP